MMACNPSDEYLDEEHKILSEKLNLPEAPFDYTPRISEGIQFSFPELGAELTEDPLRNHQATMGRVLFYDTRLSQNNKISCASCHLQERAFADKTSVSRGFEGQEGHRNALALAVTVGFEISYGGVPIDGFAPPSSAFFSWDDSVFNLFEQSRRAITSEIEMGMTMHEVVSKLSNDRAYAILSNNAFGTSNIMEHHILDALRVFMNSMSSVDTKFDEGLLSAQGNPFEVFPNFTDSENNGKALFNRDCTSCHHEIHSVSLMSSANNGLDHEYADKGRGAITNFEGDMGVFKIPFLRNVALTGPYMHDGRFETLEEVINHYSEGIKDHPNLHEVLKDGMGNPRKLAYTDREKADIIAYLNTLTDYKIIKDERFSDPFN